MQQKSYIVVHSPSGRHTCFNGRNKPSTEEGIHTVCRAYETFYINEPPIPTQLLEQALRLRNSSRKLIPVQWKKTTFKHMVQPWARKWHSPFLFFNKVETEILSQSELKPLVWKRYIEDIFSLWTINRQNRTVH